MKPGTINRKGDVILSFTSKKYVTNKRGGFMFKSNRSIFLKFISLFMLMIFFVSCNNDNSNVIGVDNSVPKAPLSKSVSQAISLEMYKGPIKDASGRCNAEWRTQFELKVMLDGKNIASQCNITFYNAKGGGYEPPTAGWTEIGWLTNCTTDCGDDCYQQICGFDGEYTDGKDWNGQYLWLKAVVKNSKYGIDHTLFGKTNSSTLDVDDCDQWSSEDCGLGKADILFAAKEIIYNPPPPATPTINSTWSNNHPKIYWNSVYGADGYSVYKYDTTVEDPGWKLIKTQTGTSYVANNENRGRGRVVKYRVKSYRGSSFSDYSNTKSFSVAFFSPL
jgi:hypothetical protein